MKKFDSISSSVLQSYPKVDEKLVDSLLAEELTSFRQKIIVLDDDPTGIQTVHDVTVYTDWEEETLIRAFSEKASMFYILTNSRSFTASHTEAVHRRIAQNILTASRQTNQSFLLISRGDSTLRGHYPLETDTLRKELEQQGAHFHGEIIVPFFKEGGRFTLNNVHYVLEQDTLVPAGDTEFAKDKTFGYQSSHLGEWCEEKSCHLYPANQMIYISLEETRNLALDAIETKLLSADNFQKIIVNAIDYADIKVFAIALLRTMAKGRHFLFRTAAAVPKVMGNVSDCPLLSRKDLIPNHSSNGGLIIAGSHVGKTTQQLDYLQNHLQNAVFLEFNQHLVLSPQGLSPEVTRIVAEAEDYLRRGITTVVFTRRERVDLPDGTKEDQLKMSVAISDAVTSIVSNLSVQPSFLIAKGGITSSDIGVKALKVKKALVMGQVAPGIPVWKTESDSRFPNLPYIIFPGNVGTQETLYQIVSSLIQ